MPCPDPIPAVRRPRGRCASGRNASRSVRPLARPTRLPRSPFRPACRGRRSASGQNTSGTGRPPFRFRPLVRTRPRRHRPGHASASAWSGGAPSAHARLARQGGQPHHPARAGGSCAPPPYGRTPSARSRRAARRALRQRAQSAARAPTCELGPPARARGRPPPGPEAFRNTDTRANGRNRQRRPPSVSRIHPLARRVGAARPDRRRSRSTDRASQRAESAAPTPEREQDPPARALNPHRTSRHAAPPATARPTAPPRTPNGRDLHAADPARSRKEAGRRVVEPLRPSRRRDRLGLDALRLRRRALVHPPQHLRRQHHDHEPPRPTPREHVRRRGGELVRQQRGTGGAIAPPMNRTAEYALDATERGRSVASITHSVSTVFRTRARARRR